MKSPKGFFDCFSVHILCYEHQARAVIPYFLLIWTAFLRERTHSNERAMPSIKLLCVLCSGFVDEGAAEGRDPGIGSGVTLLRKVSLH